MYRLALRQTPKLDKVIPQTYGYVLGLYTRHPESKSLAPDGSPCTADTRGLLQRASIIVGGLQYVGKETDRRWEHGEDLSLLDFKLVQYQSSGQMVAADASLRDEIAKHGLRELMRRTGLSQHTLEAIRRGQTVRRATLQRARGSASQLLKPSLAPSLAARPLSPTRACALVRTLTPALWSPAAHHNI